MMLCDFEIEYLANMEGMIDPFINHQISGGKISYGLSSFGYDARVATQWKTYHNPYPRTAPEVDPKNIDKAYIREHNEERYVIPPHGFVLGKTVERFKIPKNVLGICMGKSTYARCGIVVNCTPLEPGWEGHVTLEFSNTSDEYVPLYANEGACQFIFYKGSTPRVTYADRKGKYQNQVDVTLPRV